MKKMMKGAAVVLAATMVLGCGITASAKAPTYGFTITEVDTIEDPDRSLNTLNDALLDVKEDNLARFLNYKGEDVLDRDIIGAKYLGKNLYTVYEATDDTTSINHSALVNDEGKVLIPFEAAMISWCDSLYGSKDRFLKVVYATEETTNKDECMIYTTDAMFSLKPEDGDKMYKGYALIFDTEKGAFVDDVKITNNDKYAVAECGDSFAVESADRKTTTLYDASGKKILDLEDGNIVVTEKYILKDNYSEGVVYDSTGKELFKSDKRLAKIEGSPDYLTEYDSDSETYTIVDLTGKAYEDTATKDYLTKGYNDYFLLENDDDEVSYVMDLTGKHVIEAPKGQDLTALKDGFYFSETDDDIYTVYCVDGKTSLPSAGSPYSLALTASEDDEDLYVMATGGYDISVGDGYSSSLDKFGLVTVTNSDSLRGVYDTITGSQILPEKYNTIKFIGQYLYAYDEEAGKWFLYSVEGPVAE